MPERYIDAIIKYLSSRNYQPLKPRQLARQMGVSEAEYGAFRESVKALRDDGRVVLGAGNALTLPQMTSRVVGVFQANPRGFGFVRPDSPNEHGDLFIPPDAKGGALDGDHVVARARKRGKRDGQMAFAGQIVEILQRGASRFTGTLEKAENTWFVLPDGRTHPPIVVRDISSASPPAGTKVVVEIVQFPEPGELPVGVIVETLGEPGELEVETLAVIRGHGLPDEWPAEVLEEARQAVRTFERADLGRREDLSGMTIVTIDPPDARDFDDAISIERHKNGEVTLGVHIADVSFFVPEGSELDKEAHQRGNSAYFPRKVIPMLPEVLSNGVCSLQEAQPRFALSAFIRYDADAEPVASRFAETVITSAKRLTYLEAQGICDGKTGGFAPEVVDLVRQMEKLARRIEARRRKAGMLHLDLPAVELVFDETNRVVDAVPEDDAYTHTIIEMFMVEANEAAARLLHRLDRPCLRRIHPEPAPQSGNQFTSFVRACGHKVPKEMSREDIQALLEAVRGRPESYAVNLAVLKTFQQAEYSPMIIGHFALASEHYCHFTSPIRRYPDLTIHRLLREHIRGTLNVRPPEDVAELTALGSHCSATERRAEAAEQELRDVLILQFLEKHVGDTFEGVVTGVTNFGLFVQSRRFLVEGLVRLEDLGDDWWEVEARYGQVRGERTGRRIRIGDVMNVQMIGVDVAKRQLSLRPTGGKADEALGTERGKAKAGKNGKKGKKSKKAAAGKAGAQTAAPRKAAAGKKPRRTRGRGKK